jgi:DNA-binding NarL/FixJ family response regulator
MSSLKELNQGNILILEDDGVFARVVRGRLNVLFPDYKIITFETLHETREFLKDGSTDFELVVLDHHLPDGFGLDFLQEGVFEDMAVLVLSSDDAPDMAGESVRAGAAYFLNKNELSSELFFPLVRGLIERNRLQRELAKNKMREASLQAVRVLVKKLKHEVNNPLGAVLGAAYLLRGFDVSSADYLEAAKLVELSSMRIKKVMDALCAAVEDDFSPTAERTTNQRPSPLQSEDFRTVLDGHESSSASLSRKS